MKTEGQLRAALERWQNGFHFPYAAIKPTSDVEFDFCEPDDPGALAANIIWLHDSPDHLDIHGLVAWLAGDPDQFWTWDKESHPLIGWDYLALCRRMGRDVQLVATVEEWFRDAGNAVCVIDWQADIRRIFHGVNIASQNEDVKRKFARAWKWKAAKPPIRREARDG